MNWTITVGFLAFFALVFIAVSRSTDHFPGILRKFPWLLLIQNPWLDGDKHRVRMSQDLDHLTRILVPVANRGKYGVSDVWCVVIESVEVYALHGRAFSAAVEVIKLSHEREVPWYELILDSVRHDQQIKFIVVVGSESEYPPPILIFSHPQRRTLNEFIKSVARDQGSEVTYFLRHRGNLGQAVL